jgi:hypothetical protein
VSCGGTSLYIAKLCADGADAVPPHVDPGMEGNQRERILGFIADDPLPIDRSKLLAEVTEGAAELSLAELMTQTLGDLSRSMRLVATLGKQCMIAEAERREEEAKELRRMAGEIE